MDHPCNSFDGGFEINMVAQKSISTEEREEMSNGQEKQHVSSLLIEEGKERG